MTDDPLPPGVALPDESARHGTYNGLPVVHRDDVPADWHPTCVLLAVRPPGLGTRLARLRPPLGVDLSTPDPAAARPPTDYENLVSKIRANDWRPRPDGYRATPGDALMVMLGYDPTQDGLYLCYEGCGITWDHECDYGGWHGDEGKDAFDILAALAAVERTIPCESEEDDL